MTKIKTLTIILLSLLFSVSINASEKEKMRSNRPINAYVIGFYNLENLFDTIDTPNKNDSEYLPDGSNAFFPI